MSDTSDFPDVDVAQATAGTTATSDDDVIEAMKDVVDPELGINVVDLGLVYVVTLAEAAEKTNVEIEMTLTSPACPAGPQIIQQSKDVLGRIEGVGDVNVKLVMIPPWTPDRMKPRRP